MTTGLKGMGKVVFNSINNLRTEGRTCQSAACWVHTCHSYIFSIIWHRKKASKLTEHQRSKTVRVDRGGMRHCEDASGDCGLF